MLTFIIVTVSLVTLAATLLAYLPSTLWWIRACEFPRLQITVMAAVALLCAPLTDATWAGVTLAASLVTMLLQARHILPWTPIWPLQVKNTEPGHEDRCVTLLIANVLTPNRNAAGLVELVKRHQPDIVLTLESDDWWQEQLDEALSDDWPYAVRIPQDNLYGMHLYSRLSLESPTVEWLIQDDIPSIVTGVTLPCGDTVRLHALHPRPPAPNESEESLWRDAELLLIGKRIHEEPIPTLVAGDLNDVAWSRTTRLFCRVSGMLDPRRGRGMFSTFHANYPLLRWPLDHVFVSEHFTLGQLRRLPGFGSDHFPILATLCYRPARSDEHEPPSACQEEHRIAKATIQEGEARTQEP